jgi:signal transduction histidine kinase
MATSPTTDTARSLDTAEATLVDAAELERRRLERDLHDHAERRLLALALRLQELQGGFAARSEGAEGVAVARRELDAALRDLRELVLSMHPTALAWHGLRVAVDALATRSTIPVSVDVDVPHRPPAAVEIMAYYLVAEALADAAEHPGASRAAVVVRLRDDELFVEVGDDGSGGADPTVGTGLRGLADRIAALGGSLAVFSSPGGGTTVHARIPEQPGSSPAELAA